MRPRLGIVASGAMYVGRTQGRGRAPGARRWPILFVGLATAALYGGGAASAAAPLTERVSVSSQGAEGHGESWVDAITPNGRYILFGSRAADLVPGDGNHSEDVFVRDRVSHTTRRVSVQTDERGLRGDSLAGGITPDGRYVVFLSTATNVVPGPDTNQHATDVFVRDRLRGVTRRVSVRSDGSQFPDSTGFSNLDANEQMQISDDGRFVSFSAWHGYRFRAYIRDRLRKTTTRLARADKNALPLGMSPGGQYVAIATGGTFDSNTTGFFLRDRAHSRNIPISTLLPPGTSPYYGPAFITAQARYVAFTAGWKTYLFDRRRNTVARVPTPTGTHSSAFAAGLSQDGRYVCVVVEHAGSLGVYRYDMTNGTAIRADILSTGAPSLDTWVLGAAMSGDHHVVGFSTTSAGVPNDTNRVQDAYVRVGLP